MNDDTFLWHDFETFGTDPRRDRPCQFAALRTDAGLEPVEDPVVLYCQPTADVLPVPEACLVTGITPQQARDQGLPEYRFAAAVNELMSRPGTCSVGYNNFRFDDEVTRYLLWRNFHDPYAREYANGNSRFDLIDVMRLTRALRPEGIEWPNRDDGTPSFRLEDLAAANGLDVRRAHDALADVENTLGLARLLRARRPKLWAWALSLRHKHRVAGLLEKRQVLLHASARFPAAQHCLAPVLPLFPHPHIATQWLAWNLREDPEPFTFMDPEELADRYWTATRDLPEDHQRLPVKWVRINRCPMLAPMGVLDPAARLRLTIDSGRVERHAGLLGRRTSFQQVLRQLFAEPRDGQAADPELDLYGGFVPGADRNLAAQVPAMSPEELAELDTPFQDARLNSLLSRYRARHFPHTLSPAEAAEWRRYRARRLLSDPELATIQLTGYRARIAALFQSNPEHRALLEQLAAWPEQAGMTDLDENEETSS